MAPNFTIQPIGQKNNTWKKVTIGTATGILFGSLVTTLTSATVDVPIENEEDTADNTPHVHPAYVDDQIAIATTVNDDMSFSQAFAAARREVGPGGVFEWHGKLYGTYYAEEWDAMSDAERDEYFQHFNWAQHHSDYQEPQPEAQETTDTASADDIAVIEANEHQEPEIEVLGVYHDDQYNMNIGGLSIDGQEVVFVDVDNDGQFDYALSDLNHNGVIDENEVAEVNDPRINVQNFAEASGMNSDVDANGDLASANDPDYTNDANVDAYLA